MNLFLLHQCKMHILCFLLFFSLEKIWIFSCSYFHLIFSSLPHRYLCLSFEEHVRFQVLSRNSRSFKFSSRVQKVSCIITANEEKVKPAKKSRQILSWDSLFSTLVYDYKRKKPQLCSQGSLAESSPRQSALESAELKRKRREKHISEVENLRKRERAETMKEFHQEHHILSVRRALPHCDKRRPRLKSKDDMRWECCESRLHERHEHNQDASFSSIQKKRTRKPADREKGAQQLSADIVRKSRTKIENEKNFLPKNFCSIHRHELQCGKFFHWECSDSLSLLIDSFLVRKVSTWNLKFWV